jgi:metal-dependent hydrolase (beta-lactamase superfamily II)
LQLEVFRRFREGNKNVVYDILGGVHITQKGHRERQQVVEVLLVYTPQRILAAALESPFEQFVFNHLCVAKLAVGTIVRH